jgi:hypothetical protein
MSVRPLAKAQVFAGALCLFLGLLLISRARFAYLHHTLVWGKTWMDPIQAAVAGILCLLIGGYALGDAIVKRMR